MNYLYERVAYLRGLAEGMGLSEESKEGKILLNMIDILEDFADAIDELNQEVKDLDEYVETVDEDLAAVEDELYGEMEDDDYDDEEEEDIDFIEIECPNCHETIYLDEDLVYDTEDESEVICPSCHEKIHFEDACSHENGCCGHHNHDEE